MSAYHGSFLYEDHCRILVNGYITSQDWAHDPTISVDFRAGPVSLNCHLSPTTARAVANELLEAAAHAEPEPSEAKADGS